MSNVDGADLLEAVRDLDPETTLAIVSSKTFTTVETMTNAASFREWLLDGLGGDETAVAKHVVAVSTNLDAVAAFGIDPANAFGFWDWVGGRYSMDSAIGLSTMIAIGPEGFGDLLAGFHAVDRHFAEAPPERNLPLLMGLLGIWYRDFFGAQTHAVLPYEQYLARFPAYLQQLVMESNGKRVTLAGAEIDVDTAPVVWGEPGTNGQHSFHQLLHQGTVLVPCDIVAFASPVEPLGRHHDLLLANALAQAQALAFGRTEDELRAAGVPDRLVPHKEMPGNRPTTFLLLPRLTPFALGSLVALYEHVTFTQGAVWGIDSFDQWGVELGKELAVKLAPVIAGEEAPEPLDGSTAALVERIRRLRDDGLTVLEIHEPDGAFERLEDWLRGQGFFAPGGESLVADLYLGYGLSSTIRRTTTQAPPEPCALPLVACVVRTDNYDVKYGNEVWRDGEHEHGDDGLEIGAWRRTWAPADHADAVRAVRDAIGRGDVYQVNLVQHLSAPFAGSPSALAARLAPLTQPNELPFADSGWRVLDGGELGDRLRHARAPRRPTRLEDLDAADQGDAAPRSPCRAPRLRQGRGRARDDRRPRAQRPLARLPSRAASAGRS